MKQLLLLFAILCLAEMLRAQAYQTDSLHRRFEVGLNVTNTLGNFVGSSGGLTNDPYLLSFRFGKPASHVRLGLNFKIQDKTDPNLSDIFKEKATIFRLRAGYEWVYPVARRLAMYWGLDAVFERETDDIETFTQIGFAKLKNQYWGVGGGPVLGISWRVHPRVSLTTESSMYAVIRRGTELVNAPPDFSSHNVRDFLWQPLLPTSLYVNFAF